MIKNIIQGNHGGVLSIESKYAEGTAVKIEIPKAYHAEM